MQITRVSNLDTNTLRNIGLVELATNMSLSGNLAASTSYYITASEYIAGENTNPNGAFQLPSGKNFYCGFLYLEYFVTTAGTGIFGVNVGQSTAAAFSPQTTAPTGWSAMGQSMRSAGSVGRYAQLLTFQATILGGSGNWVGFQLSLGAGIALILQDIKMFGRIGT